MRNKDKLARFTNSERVAIWTLKCNVPFWCTLTARESRGKGVDRGAFYRRNASNRRELRAFMRALCA